LSLASQSKVLLSSTSLRQEPTPLCAIRLDVGQRADLYAAGADITTISGDG
jgi:hypothetical protein